MISNVLVTLIALPLALFIIPASADCAYGIEDISPRIAAEKGTVPIPPFNYLTTTGPENWHHLNSAYHACADGKTQSPILISSTPSAPVSTAPRGSIKLTVPNQKNVEFENLGTNVEVVVNGSMKTAAGTWSLKQFHFHTPSEHRVDLGHFDAEMHFVFSIVDSTSKTKPAAGVLGFFVEVVNDFEHSTNLLEEVFKFLPEIQKPGTTTTIPYLDFTAFTHIANSWNTEYYQYVGSLTTPPCTQGVIWYLSKTPIRLRLSTYKKLKGTTKTNNRYTQNNLDAENILEVAAVGI